MDIIHKTFVIQGEKGSQGNTGNAGKNGEKVSENCCFDAHNLKVISNKKLTFHVILLSFLWSVPCLVPVRCFPRPFRLIHFGDVSETNLGETHFFAQTT